MDISSRSLLYCHTPPTIACFVNPGPMPALIGRGGCGIINTTQASNISCIRSNSRRVYKVITFCPCVALFLCAAMVKNYIPCGNRYIYICGYASMYHAMVTQGFILPKMPYGGFGYLSTIILRLSGDKLISTTCSN